MALDLDALSAALASSTEPTVVPLGGKTVRVVPPMDWRQSTMQAINRGDFSTWASKVLVNDLTPAGDGVEASGSDDYAIWTEVDPTNREVGEFLLAYQQVAGQAPGK